MPLSKISILTSSLDVFSSLFGIAIAFRYHCSKSIFFDSSSFNNRSDVLVLLAVLDSPLKTISFSIEITPSCIASSSTVLSSSVRTVMFSLPKMDRSVLWGDILSAYSLHILM